MNKYKERSFTLRRLSTILGGLLLAFFGGIYLTNGFAQTRVVENPAAQNLVPGRLLYSSVTFSGLGNIRGYVYTAAADGSGQSLFPNSSFLPNQPTWTADGTKILYSQGDIYIANGSGNGDINLTNTDSVNEESPASSITGKIAYVRGGEIWVMNADGTGQTKFSAITALGQLAAPAWSPDGTKLAFAFALDGGAIWRINADGSNQQRVTTTGGDPAWSPDGTKIVFGKGGSITIINADGTGETTITNGFSDIQPSWSPDGTKIAFRRQTGEQGIYTMDVNGGNQIRIVPDTSTTTPNTQTVRQNPEWQPLFAPRRSTFDFDGDGRADVSVFRPDNGAWYVQQSQAGFTGSAFGQSGDKLAPADYDGDGKTDVAVVRNGTWYLQRSQAGFTGVVFGDANDIPVPADYDGDRKADIAVFRPSNGTWYLLQSTAGFTGIALGLGTDKPVPGDYNGDGKAEVAVFRPSNGYWYLSTNPATGYGGIQFGATEDKPVPADYDGDGKTDLAVFRPSTGSWYLQQSTAGTTGLTFGLGTDIPVAADYDGDGKADVAVVRNGNWYLNRSTQGFTGIQFGTSTDLPIPNAFVR